MASVSMQEQASEKCLKPVSPAAGHQYQTTIQVGTTSAFAAKRSIFRFFLAVFYHD